MRKNRLFQLYWPLLIEQFLTYFIGVVSTMLVSNGVSQAAYSGVGLVDQVNYLITYTINGFVVGVTVAVARNVGKRDMRAASEVAGQSRIFLILIGLGFGTVLTVFGPQILGFLYGSAEADVMAACMSYFRYSALSYPFYALFGVSAGILRGVGDTRSPMVASLVANIVNVAVAAPLIFVAKIGVAGAGIGLLAARAVSGAFLFFIAQFRQNRIVLPKFSFKMSRKVLAPVVEVGLPSAIDSFIFNGSKVFVATFISGMGTAHIAANTAAGLVYNLLNMAGNAFSMASTTVVGQSFGAKNYRQVRKDMGRLMKYCTFAMIGVSAVGIIGMNWLIGIFNPSAEAFALCQRILFIAFLAAPLWAPSFSLPYSLRAAGDAKYCLVISIISLFALRIFGAWLFGVYLGWGVVGVWTSMILDWAGRTLGFLPRYVGNGWFKGTKDEFVDADAEPQMY